MCSSDLVAPARPCASCAVPPAASPLQVAALQMKLGVTVFQGLAGLAVDGDPGPETRKAYLAALAP